MTIDLKPSVTTRYYQFNSQIKLRVQNMFFENEISAHVKQSFIKYQEADVDADGHYTGEGYIIQIDILDFQQMAKDELNQLFAEINTLTNKVIIRTDNYGCIEEVLNIDEIVDKWKQLKPALFQKQKNRPNAQQFLDAFEKQFTEVGEIEYALENKGVYALLFAGLYDREYGGAYGFEYDHYKTIHNYFNQISLPLSSIYTIAPKQMIITQDSEPGSWSTLPQQLKRQYIEITCADTKIHESEFNRAAFATYIKTLTKSLRAKTNILLSNDENYLLDEDGWIVNARQTMRTEVAGVYMNEQSRQITCLTPQPQ